MSVHLSEEQESNNVRNGHNKKTVLTVSGALPLAVPRYRRGSIELHLVEKYSRRLLGFDDQVIHWFAKRLSTRQIRASIRELYGVEASADLIALVPDAPLAILQTRIRRSF